MTYEFAILLAIVLLLVFAIAALSLRHGTERLRRFAKVWRKRRELRSMLRKIGQEGEEIERRHRRAFTLLNNRRFEEKLRTTTVSELSSYGASGSRYGALERVGVRTLADLRDFKQAGRSLESVHGVGAKSAGAIVAAFQRYVAEQGAKPIRLPEPDFATNETAHYFQICALRAYMETEIRPRRVELRARHEEVEFVSIAAVPFVGSERLQQAIVRVDEVVQELRPRFDLLEADFNSARQRLSSKDAVVAFAKNHRSQFEKVVNAGATDGLPAPTIAGQLANLEDAVASSETERDFEDRIITPFLERLGVPFVRQYPLKIRVGSRYIDVFTDYLVEDRGEFISLIENKRSVRNDADLNAARDQAFSYAVQLRLASFVVAAKEGFWLYDLPRHRPHLVQHYSPEEAFEHAAEILRFMRSKHAQHR